VSGFHSWSKAKRGHYGAMRGLDHMKHVDAIETIGDPKQNDDEVRHGCTSEPGCLRRRTRLDVTTSVRLRAAFH
jgi:hypothetical protein